MKKIHLVSFFIFAILVAASPVFAQQYSGDLHIKLSLTETEKTDTANTVTTRIIIDDNVVTYNWSYSGYHPDKNFKRTLSKKIILNRKNVAMLKRLLVAGGFYNNISLQLPVTHFGTNFSAELSCTMDGKNAKASIIGTAGKNQSYRSVANLVSYIEEVIFSA